MLRWPIICIIMSIFVLTHDCPGAKCRKCGKGGHQARECYYNQEYHCYRCEGVGHLARECSSEVIVSLV